MGDLRTRLETALNDRYRLKHELGSGGMATVFAAEDRKHHREVAIKVLSPELASAIGPERFVRELETVGRLTHPHILPMFDSGTADGLPYFVMPVVEGESLRAHLQRERQLGVEEALRLAREVADALTYAHKHGVVHRDVKPENILLAGGHALLADFGVAHAVDDAARERLTRTGIVVGTPHYMSPEQASGERALDGRSDQYALACVLYELLAGVPPFTGPSAESLIHQHLSLAPRPVTALRAGVPTHVSDALRRALAKVPGDRFSSCTHFAAAFSDGVPTGRTPVEGGLLFGLVPPSPSQATPSSATVEAKRPAWRPRRWMVALGAVALLAGAMGVRQWLVSPAAKDSHALVVLPLANLSGDSAQVYFADGMTEELTAELSLITALRVVSRTTAARYRQSKKSLPEIARELGVNLVVEGSVRREGDEVVVTAELVDARHDRHLWGERYRRPLRHILTLQAEIASAIAREVRVRLTPSERARLSRRREVVPEALEAYLRGRFLLGRVDTERYRQVLELFETALRLDPNYADAWSGIADAWYLGSSMYTPATEAMPRVKQAVERALAIDPDLATAHATLGCYLAFYETRWADGEASLRRSIELDPNQPQARLYLGQLMYEQRRFDEAQVQLDRAAQLEPVSPYYLVGGALPSLYAGRYSEAKRRLEQILEVDSSYSNTSYAMGVCELTVGRPDRAIELFRRALRQDHTPYILSMLGYALARSGEVREAEDLAERIRNARDGASHSADLALVLAGLGRVDEAFELLEHARSQHEEILFLLGCAPYWRILYTDPRFARLLDRLGLPHPPGVGTTTHS